jgi:hypothetical protein
LPAHLTRTRGDNLPVQCMKAQSFITKNRWIMLIQMTAFVITYRTHPVNPEPDHRCYQDAQRKNDSNGKSLWIHARITVSIISSILILTIPHWPSGNSMIGIDHSLAEWSYHLTTKLSWSIPADNGRRTDKLEAEPGTDKSMGGWRKQSIAYKGRRIWWSMEIIGSFVPWKKQYHE